MLLYAYQVTRHDPSDHEVVLSVDKVKQHIVSKMGVFNRMDNAQLIEFLKGSSDLETFAILDYITSLNLNGMFINASIMNDGVECLNNDGDNEAFPLLYTEDEDGNLQKMFISKTNGVLNDSFKTLELADTFTYGK